MLYYLAHFDSESRGRVGPADNRVGPAGNRPLARQNRTENQPLKYMAQQLKCRTSPRSPISPPHTSTVRDVRGMHGNIRSTGVCAPFYLIVRRCGGGDGAGREAAVGGGWAPREGDVLPTTQGRCVFVRQPPNLTGVIPFKYSMFGLNFNFGFVSCM